ncbi:ABC transporter substrate-binding protein [Tsukamurella sp. 8F]|uniref:ABC transporter family substrate-binding protein n=1 Tax=unclassified Tsukamurella TaxID=2633480 RepID=UPI0023B9ACFD|nr:MULTISPECIES: ABC transporter substrate-binding protein [unclassified Tsukamurella]MDF0530078.1 ABC transporter substrate-binding protein [Tsukamurella sp. 8J]MDF0586396.1 ABC transporter substrate-binding protein [Tsukamurella sp. 8F]
MIGRVRRRSLPAVLVALALIPVMLGACAADPPPAVHGSDTSTPTPMPGATGTEVVVAVDDLGLGFNPHLQSDASPATQALAAMTLPSPFRPVVVQGGRTEYRQDTDLVPVVTQPTPLTVTYTIRQDAQWSDGAPISAEDFVYLWQSMITAPDTAGSAPYRQIASIDSGAGGKRVTVHLKAPLPGWRQLFTDLVPSHLVKGAPGGFTGAMRDKIPASGAGFLVKKVDLQRDEVTLERNDRYWMSPSKVDRIVIRRGGTDTQVANSVRTGDVQVVAMRGGASLLAQLGSIYEVKATETAAPRLMSLTLNTRSKFLSDVAVRRALLASLDVNLLTTVGSGGNTVRPARAQVLAPSNAGYMPTAPARPANPAEAKQQLADALATAGYTLQTAAIPPTQSAPPTTASVRGQATVTVPPSASEPSGASESALSVPPSPSPGESVPQYVRDGVPMFLRIGVVAGNQQAFSVASNATDQLRSMGVFASVVTLDPDSLTSTALLDGTVDAVVGWNSVTSDPAVRLASRVSCLPPAAGTTVAPSASASPEASATPGPGPVTATSTPAPSSEVPASSSSTSASDATLSEDEAAKLVGGNISGLCDADLQQVADQALEGRDAENSLAAADRMLWQDAVELPIFQDVTVAAVAPTVLGVTLAGPLSTGVFTVPEQWERRK